MKYFKTIIVAVAIAGCFSSCETPESMAVKSAQANAWLASQQAASRINVSGKWFSAEWGATQLNQSGRNVTGSMGNYQVKGVVSGNKAYLTTWESGKCYYVLILGQQGRNVLTGTYTEGPVYIHEPEEQGAAEFRRSY